MTLLLSNKLTEKFLSEITFKEQSTRSCQEKIALQALSVLKQEPK